MQEAKNRTSDYPEGTITISTDEYRDLLDTQARASVLRMQCVFELDDTLEKQSVSEYESLHRVKDAKISVAQVMNTMGFYPTYHGFLVKEENMKKEQAE